MRELLQPRRGSALALALLVSALVVAACAATVRVPAMNSFDQPFYIGPAYDLATTGRFTDGFIYAASPPGSERPSGRMFAPLYPAFLALFAVLDPRVLAGFECVVRTAGNDTTCGDALAWVRFAHYAMVTAVFTMVWCIAREIGPLQRATAPDRSQPSPVAAAFPWLAQTFPWLALGASFFAAQRIVKTASFAMTESVTLLLLTASVLAGVLAYTRQSRRAAAVAGALLGATALTRPAYVYLYAVASLIVVLATLPRSRRTLLPLAVLFVGGGAALLAPWMVRNAAIAVPAVDYRAHTLVQRLAYNAMTTTEWAQSFVCFLPGRSLGEIAFGKAACHRFDWAAPDGFYLTGQAQMGDAVAAAGGWDKTFRYLLVNKVLAAPVWHAAVTLTLALLGGWIANWFGVVFALAAMRLTAIAFKVGWVPYLIVALPGWFMLVFHGAVSVNQDRYNFYLVVPYALAAAVVIQAALERFGGNAVAAPFRSTRA